MFRWNAGAACALPARRVLAWLTHIFRITAKLPARPGGCLYTCFVRLVGFNCTRTSRDAHHVAHPIRRVGLFVSIKSTTLLSTPDCHRLGNPPLAGVRICKLCMCARTVSFARKLQSVRDGCARTHPARLLTSLARHAVRRYGGRRRTLRAFAESKSNWIKARVKIVSETRAREGREVLRRTTATCGTPAAQH